MVSTRQSLGEQRDSPDAVEDPRIQAVLRKLRIDGNDALKGEPTSQSAAETPLRIYRSKGASYLEIGTEPPEWLQNRGRRTKRRRETITQEVDRSHTVVDDRDRKDAKSHVHDELELAEENGPPSKRRRLRRIDKKPIYNFRRTIRRANKQERPRGLRRSTQSMRSKIERKEQARLTSLDLNRQRAKGMGYAQDALSEDALRETLGKTLANKLLRIGQLNSKIVKGFKALGEGGWNRDEMMRKISGDRCVTMDIKTSPDVDGLAQDPAAPDSAGRGTHDACQTPKIKQLESDGEVKAPTVAVPRSVSPTKRGQYTPVSDSKSTPASVAHSFVTADQSPENTRRPGRPASPTRSSASLEEESNGHDTGWKLDLSRLEQPGRAERAIRFERRAAESDAARLRRINREVAILRSWPS